MGPSSSALLEISHLSTSFFTDKGEVRAVEDVSFRIQPRQTLALVGESGCGKSVTALSIMRLLDYPGRIVGGHIFFRGRDLLSLSDKELRKVRGKDIGIVFQEPMTSLNPVFTIGDQIGEVLEIHTDLTKQGIRQEVIRLLEKVRIPSAERRIDQYPHEMSGGMKQRLAPVAIATPRSMIRPWPTASIIRL